MIRRYWIVILVALMLCLPTLIVQAFQFKRGMESALPFTAKQGEPIWTTDTHRLFVGYSTGRQEVKTADSQYGGIYIYKNTSSVTFNKADSYVAFIRGGVGSLSGWTYQAGKRVQLNSGTTFAAMSTTYLRCYATGHGFAKNEAVTISGSTDYEGTYVIRSVLTDSFVIPKTYVSAENAAGRWARRPASLTAGTNSAGEYLVSFAVSFNQGTKDKNYKVEMRRCTPSTYVCTDLDNITAQQITPTTTAGGDSTINLSSSGIVAIAAGDIVFGVVKNITDTTAITPLHYNFNLHRL